jgi:hypothetical protein
MGASCRGTSCACWNCMCRHSQRAPRRRARAANEGCSASHPCCLYSASFTCRCHFRSVGLNSQSLRPGHVDATLRLLGPIHGRWRHRGVAADPQHQAVPAGGAGPVDPRRLRQAETPRSAAQIVSAILAAGGHGESARRTVAPWVRGNLADLKRRGKVGKSGVGKSVRWNLV